MKGWEASGVESSIEGEGRETERDSRNSGGSHVTHLFCIGINVRSFKAAQHLPLRSVNAFVRVFLPPEIVRPALEVCKLPSRVTAPLRTHPPVFVERGTEVTFTNGYVALDVPASPTGMASILALQPKLVAHVLHRDKYESDSVLGVATVPMTRLMEQPVVDSYAQVRGPSIVRGMIEDYRYEGSSGLFQFQCSTLLRATSFLTLTTDHVLQLWNAMCKVKIGSLRVVLAIDDMGIMGTSDSVNLRTGACPSFMNQLQSDDLSIAKLDDRIPAGLNHVERGMEPVHNVSEAELPGKLVEKLHVAREAPGYKTRKSSCRNGKSTSSNGSLLGDSKDGNMKSETGNDEEVVRKRPEYEMAWEFEIWRRSEEIKWLADLKQQEAIRMKALEEEWRKKEKLCIADMRNFQAEQDELEAKLRAKLLQLEKRERTLNMAEEDLVRRKEELERSYSNRTSEAQVAIMRLQSECEHRVELERSKFTALQQQYDILEQRLSTSNSSFANLEEQFREYQSAQRNTVEADLLMQIIALEQQCNNLQRKMKSVLKSRNDYKSQVLSMAKELGKLHRMREFQRPDSDANRHVFKTQSAIESQCRKAREDRLELQRLEEQLTLLQLQEQEPSNNQKEFQHSPKQVDSKSIGQETHLVSKNRLPKLILAKAKECKNGTDSFCLSISEVGAMSCYVLHLLVKMTSLWIPMFVFDDGFQFLLQNAPEKKADKSDTEHLLNQRAYLLGTGVYSVKDRIIQGLDKACTS
uniref:Uncharacterized protein n=1 Tax=Physcomitrium patens TaxID=3218 RepID=A0A2K1J2B7_PHYPA|nr:hypothetical protein PHYPA_021516 [Physcomitrium patens]